MINFTYFSCYQYYKQAVTISLSNHFSHYEGTADKVRVIGYKEPISRVQFKAFLFNSSLLAQAQPIIRQGS